jgi:hypothetical protein
MSLDDVIVVYVVRKTPTGFLTVQSLKEDNHPDAKTAIKQIAIMASEEAKDRDHARVG